MYYTKKEALEKLGIPESTFYQMVSDGRIRSYLPPHKKRGALYDREQIDAIVAIQIATGQKLPTEEHLMFGASTEVDLAQEVALGLDMYGADDIVPLKKLRQWWQRNPEMFLALKRSDGVLVGYSSITPMREETILKLIRDEIREADVNPQDIYPYSTSIPLTCYIASLTTVPGPKQHQYAVRLIFDVALFLKKLGERGVNITRFYGIGASEEGRTIAERLGFNEIYRSPTGDRVGYVLDANDTSSKLVQYYQAGKSGLASKK
ncbi:MAG TPA: helix-turn-helix domain-containing protein [Ktedonobacteraceae bacterium]|nr:helix-turn-helix domain-containing protein [Ktedonobacteraceae bacterium]